MKTTMTLRSLANPRRTTLAHLADAAGLAPAALPGARSAELPRQTANPRRTVLDVRPGA
ncbi:hypothetical protein [Streptomyces specialis]|uniref:hypothetical protein n=1 Tax=Streptomyces specialis TaxID=498367 RepID=UPI0018FE6034|nr:hypothetical protein [Streptomyces specialis]